MRYKFVSLFIIFCIAKCGFTATVEPAYYERYNKNIVIVDYGYKYLIKVKGITGLDHSNIKQLELILFDMEFVNDSIGYIIKQIEAKDDEIEKYTIQKLREILITEFMQFDCLMQQYSKAMKYIASRYNV